MLTGKERFDRILLRQDIDRNAFFPGMPDLKALNYLREYFQAHSYEQLLLMLKGDILYIEGYEKGPIYKNPKDNLTFHTALKYAERLRAYEKSGIDIYKTYYNRVSNKRLDFAISNNLATLYSVPTLFIKRIVEHFGCDELKVKMHINPDSADYALEKLFNVYYDINEEVYIKYEDRLDAALIFNDITNPLNDIIDAEIFRSFVLPKIGRLIEQAKRHGLKVILSISDIMTRYIPKLIEYGADVLFLGKHLRKDYSTLYNNFGSDVIFMGGINYQKTLIEGSASAVRNECIKLKNIFGKHYILSPDILSLNSSISGQNIRSMAIEGTNLLT